MSEYFISTTNKKTDEPLIQEEQNSDLVEVKFTALDVVRMLTGLLIIFCLSSKLFTGSWYYIPFMGTTNNHLQDPLKIPQYWLEKNHEHIPISFSLEELSKYKGQDEPERILLSVKGHVFDVTKGSRFYGKWGGYKKFSGTDCSKLFSYPQWDISVLNKACDHDLTGVAPAGLARVDAWLHYFQRKYPEIGYIDSLLQ